MADHDIKMNDVHKWTIFENENPSSNPLDCRRADFDFADTVFCGKRAFAVVESTNGELARGLLRACRRERCIALGNHVLRKFLGVVCQVG